MHHKGISVGNIKYLLEELNIFTLFNNTSKFLVKQILNLFFII